MLFLLFCCSCRRGRLWTLDRNDEDDNRVSLLQFADEKRVVKLV